MTATPSRVSEWLTPGARVRVTQQVQRSALGGGTLAAVVTGTVQRYEQQKTGSWFAHAKDHKVWLDRLVLKKDDGEIVYLNLDHYSIVEPG